MFCKRIADMYAGLMDRGSYGLEALGAVPVP
jgi:hypothetical protein